MQSRETLIATRATIASSLFRLRHEAERREALSKMDAIATKITGESSLQRAKKFGRACAEEIDNESIDAIRRFVEQRLNPALRQAALPPIQ